MADISPVHKKDETSNKNNYRPVSVLHSNSNICERDMDEHLSQFLCGFRKGYSAKHLKHYVRPVEKSIR